MKRSISPKSDGEMLAKYERVSRNHGWFFKFEEVANGCFTVEAADIYGRIISRSGNDPDAIIERIEREIEIDFPKIGQEKED